jgi:predicted ester cyclase
MHHGACFSEEGDQPPQIEGETTMSLEDNKAIVRRYLNEPWNQGNLAILDELCAPGFCINGIASLAEIKRAIFEARRAFPDIHDTIEEIIAEGDTVVIRWTITGTHRGVYEGIPPTGKPIKFTGITIVHLCDGKIVEDRFEGGSPSFKEQVSDPAESP